MTCAQLIDEFLADRSRAGRRDSTLRTYRSQLRPLADQIGAIRCDQLTRRQLLDAMHALQGQGPERKSNATIRLQITLVSQLQSFALDEGILTAGWLKPKDLKKPRPRRRDRIATPAETAQLLAEMTPAYRRLYQCYRLTGARRGELIAATVADLHGEAGGRAIVLKTHKTSAEDGRSRVIHLGDQAESLVREAIGSRTFGRIFLDDHGRPWTGEKVTRIFRTLRRRLGLDEELTIHSTRHEFATAIVARRGLQEARELLGHADIGTTQRYSHLQPEHLRRCLDGLYGSDDDSTSAA